MLIDTKKRKINIGGKVAWATGHKQPEYDSSSEIEFISDDESVSQDEQTSQDDRASQGGSISQQSSTSRGVVTAARHPASRNADFQGALRGCDASAFVHALANSLDKMPPKTVQTLKSSLMPLLKPNNTPKHCARCHKTFTESTNTTKSCIIWCTRPKETNIPDEEYDQEYKFKFVCCNRIVSHDEAMGGDWEPGHDECFEGKHKIDPTSVKYYRGEDWPRKKIEDGLDHSGCNKNVQTCKAMGCGKRKR